MSKAGFTKLFISLLVSLLVSCAVLSYTIVRFVSEDGTNSFNSLIRYKFSVKGQQNDVVLIGDSSLLMGVMPTELEKRYGIKAINLGVVGYCGPLVFDLLLDTYLKNNSRPKLIVFYLAASTPYFFDDRRYEKTYAYGRHASFFSLVENMNQVGILDLMNAARKILFDKLCTLPDSGQKSEIIMKLSDAKGFSANGSSVPLPQTKETDSWNSKKLSLDYLKKIKQRYTTKDTRVVVYLAPMPETEISYQYFLKRYRGVVDNQPHQLPNDYFADASHLNQYGALCNSEIIGRFIKSLDGL